MSNINNDVQILLDRYQHIDHDLVTCDNERCTLNLSQIPSVWNDDYEISYYINVRCTVCHQIWKLCTECKLKKKLVRQEQIRTHKYKYHDKKRKINLIDTKAKQSKLRKCDETDDDSSSTYNSIIVFMLYV
jgi:antirestriction protein